MIAAVPAYTLLEFISRKVLHELRENCLAKVHPSLEHSLPWAQSPCRRTSAHLKKLKSKNLKTVS